MNPAYRTSLLTLRPYFFWLHSWYNYTFLYTILLCRDLILNIFFSGIFKKLNIPTSFFKFNYTLINYCFIYTDLYIWNKINFLYNYISIDYFYYYIQFFNILIKRVFKKNNFFLEKKKIIFLFFKYYKKKNNKYWYYLLFNNLIISYIYTFYFKFLIYCFIEKKILFNINLFINLYYNLKISNLFINIESIIWIKKWNFINKQLLFYLKKKDNIKINNTFIILWFKLFIYNKINFLKKKKIKTLLFWYDYILKYNNLKKKTFNFFFLLKDIIINKFLNYLWKKKIKYFFLLWIIKKLCLRYILYFIYKFLIKKKYYLFIYFEKKNFDFIKKYYLLLNISKKLIFYNITYLYNNKLNYLLESYIIITLKKYYLLHLKLKKKYWFLQRKNLTSKDSFIKNKKKYINNKLKIYNKDNYTILKLINKTIFLKFINKYLVYNTINKYFNIKFVYWNIYFINKVYLFKNFKKYLFKLNIFFFKKKKLWKKIKKQILFYKLLNKYYFFCKFFFFKKKFINSNKIKKNKKYFIFFNTKEKKKNRFFFLKKKIIF